MTFILDIFGGSTSKGYNSQTITPIFYYNPCLESTASDLQAQIHTSSHLLSFWASSDHSKPSNIELEIFVPKTIPKIHDNFIDTHDMALRLTCLTDIIKMNIHL